MPAIGFSIIVQQLCIIITLCDFDRTDLNRSSALGVTLVVSCNKVV